ncbi:MATE family efflux transporter [Yunchengibacter salinarum]|uniref:MATE family efflux transporter n=1 Tax=Yunchengibacter salinarum TaxID=3133399 RepID=UPI0035B67586
MRRHLSELIRLAVPSIGMRLGLMGLAVVDTAMVGHYATTHLAWLNLANQSVFIFALVVGLGLLLGTLIQVAGAYGADRTLECGAIWRRTLRFTALISVILVAVLWPAGLWLDLLGQTGETAERAAMLIRILALGLPGHLFFVNCTFFLEGIKRNEVPFFLILGANLINAASNYVLVYGALGAPELGAEGSAWTSTITRWTMAAMAFAFVWFAPSIRRFGVHRPYRGRWRDWALQRTIGYTSALSLAAEVAAFAGLAIFAGWLGTLPLAAHGVVFQVINLPLMIAVGIGVATSVRVGITLARRDRADTARAVMAGLGLNGVTVSLLALLVYLAGDLFLSLFTNDPRVIAKVMLVLGLLVFATIFDASQMVMSNILRGFSETWWPTVLQGTSFGLVMLPACYLLAFPAGRGLQGLIEGMLIGVLTSLALQGLRLAWLLRHPPQRR